MENKLDKFTDMIGKRRADHKKRMDEVINQLASLSERAIEIENSNLTEEEMLKELEIIQNEYLKLNNNYKEEMKAINTYNRVMRGTKDVLSRENSDDKEIPVNPKPKQEEQQDIPINILPNTKPLQPTTITSTSTQKAKVQIETKGNVRIKHSKKYYKKQAGKHKVESNYKAKGGRKPKGKART